MFLLDQEALDQFGGGGADRCRPSLQLARRPLGMCPMRGWHVLGQRGVMPLSTAAGMTGDTFAFGQHFDHVTRDTQLDGLVDQGMRHAVVIALEFDVVVDVDRGFLPLGDDEGRPREGSQVGGIHLGKGILPTARQFLEGTGVQCGQQFKNGGIQFGDREETPMAQASEYPALHHLYPGFDLGLVLWLLGPGRQDHGVVVVREFGGGPIELGFVTVWPRDQGARIVGHDQGRHAADECQGAAHAGQPVGLSLPRCRAGEGIARCAEHGDEDTGRPDFSGLGVNNRYGGAGIVRKQFLTGPVDLAHRALELAGPVPVAGTEGSVLIAALTDGLPILFPQQRQRHAFLL